MSESIGNNQGIYCKSCGFQNDWDAIWCQRCGKSIRGQSSPHQNPPPYQPQTSQLNSYAQTIPQPINKKKRTGLYAGILVLILVVTVIPGYYFWQQSQIEQQRQNELELLQKQMEQSVNGISIELTKFSWIQNYLDFEGDVTFTIANNGPLAVTLDRATSTLYVNGFNIQTKEFEEQVTIISAYSVKEYTAKFVTFDTDSVASLQYLPSPHTQLKLNAVAICDSYSSAIQVWNDGDWTPITTPNPGF